jgi:guanylate kinase
MTGQLFVFSAPSGAGKSTIIQALMGRLASVLYSVSHTTRPPRGDEKEGVDYHFVDDAAFEDMISRGELVEWASVYGSYYGTSAAKLRSLTGEGFDVLLDVDTVGACNIRRMFGGSVLIFIVPPSLDELERRLVRRGTDSQEVIRGRMAKALRMISQCVHYDYVIVNDDLTAATNRAEAIIDACRCRTPRVVSFLRQRFGLAFSDEGYAASSRVSVDG